MVAVLIDSWRVPAMSPCKSSLPRGKYTMELLIAFIVMGFIYALVRACFSGRKCRTENHESKPALGGEKGHFAENSDGARQAVTLGVGAAVMHNDDFIFLGDGESGLNDDDFLDPMNAHLPGNIHHSTLDLGDRDIHSSFFGHDTIDFDMESSKCLYTDPENFWFAGNLFHHDSFSSFSGMDGSFTSFSSIDDSFTSISSFDDSFSSSSSFGGGFDDW